MAKTTYSKLPESPGFVVTAMATMSSLRRPAFEKASSTTLQREMKAVEG